MALQLHFSSTLPIQWQFIRLRIPVKLTHTCNRIPLNHTDNSEGIRFQLNYLDKWLSRMSVLLMFTCMMVHFKMPYQLTHRFLFILTHLARCFWDWEWTLINELLLGLPFELSTIFSTECSSVWFNVDKECRF